AAPREPSRTPSSLSGQEPLRRAARPALAGHESFRILRVALVATEARRDLYLLHRVFAMVILDEPHLAGMRYYHLLLQVDDIRDVHVLFRLEAYSARGIEEIKEWHRLQGRMLSAEVRYGNHVDCVAHQLAEVGVIRMIVLGMMSEHNIRFALAYDVDDHLPRIEIDFQLAVVKGPCQSDRP